MNEDNRFSSAPLESNPRMQGRGAVLIVLLFFAYLFASSFAVFIYRMMDAQSGFPYREQPGAWPIMAGFLVRGLIGALLAWSSWAYLRASRHGQWDGRSATALTKWWRSLAIGGMAMVSYDSYLALFGGELVHVRAVSPRFVAEKGGKAEMKFELRLAEDKEQPGYRLATEPRTGRKIYLPDAPLVSNDAIEYAQALSYDNRPPVLTIRFVPEVHQKLRNATKSHLGKPLALMIDDALFMAPIAETPYGESVTLMASDLSGGIASKLASGIVPAIVRPEP